MGISLAEFQGLVSVDDHGIGSNWHVRSLPACPQSPRTTNNITTHGLQACLTTDHQVLLESIGTFLFNHPSLRFYVGLERKQTKAWPNNAERV